MSHRPGWQQANLWFTNRAQAVQIAARRIGPLFTAAERQGLASSWFYIRKEQWRWRYLPADHTAATLIAEQLTTALAPLKVTWSICEFEPAAFGGRHGMRIARNLFHIDSRELLLRHGSGHPLGQRETSVLLCSAMLRTAGLDWFEQGDVWARVSHLRPGGHAGPPARDLAEAMQTLMSIDATRITGPAQLPAAWLTAFTQTGHRLADLHRAGRLERGLRAVLAHHMIFHANRAGITTEHQGLTAALAVHVVFHQVAAPSPSPSPSRP